MREQHVLLSALLTAIIKRMSSARQYVEGQKLVSTNQQDIREKRPIQNYKKPSVTQKTKKLRQMPHPAQRILPHFEFYYFKYNTKVSETFQAVFILFLLRVLNQLTAGSKTNYPSITSFFNTSSCFNAYKFSVRLK